MLPRVQSFNRWAKTSTRRECDKTFLGSDMTWCFRATRAWNLPLNLKDGTMSCRQSSVLASATCTNGRRARSVWGRRAGPPPRHSRHSRPAHEDVEMAQNPEDVYLNLDDVILVTLRATSGSTQGSSMSHRVRAASGCRTLSSRNQHLDPRRNPVAWCVSSRLRIRRHSSPSPSLRGKFP